jgi:glycine cleavage system regulatory protein
VPQLASASRFDAALHEPHGSHASVDTFPYALKISAQRQDDVIQRVSHLMRVLHINIQDVETRLARDPSGAAMRFDIRLLLAVPRQTPVTMLRDYLQHLFSELHVEWSLNPL